MRDIKDKLIETAIEIIQREGFHNLTMRELGKSVDIKASSVMYHFKCKNTLMNELVKVYSKQFFLYLDEINESTTDPKKRISKLIDIYESSLRNEKFCLCGIFAIENDNLDHSTKELVVDFFNRLEKWLIDNLSLLNEDEVLAKIILSNLNGAMMLDSLNKQSIYCISATRKLLDMF